MKRRDLFTLIGSAAVAASADAFAQGPSRVYRVGVLGVGPPYTPKSPIGAALIRGLAQVGYTLDQNLAFEFRGADGHNERLPALVAELVASKVDVIVVRGYPTTLAAKQGTTLPVVSIDSGDPVRTGLVSSLAHPGGNLTGISDVSVELTPKRMEILKEYVPSLSRIAILWDADNLGMTLRYKAAEAGARALGIKVQPLGVREPNDFGHAFEAMNSEMPDAILMVTDFLTILDRKPVFEFAAAHRLPAIYEYAFLVHDGGLMSYGPNEDESFSRLAAIVGRILKGAQAAELPFEEPTKFEFVINQKTAKSLGITMPPILLAQADEIIE
jgi:putative tryptophan/tyrosine transport system substrate-binding protein